MEVSQKYFRLGKGAWGGDPVSSYLFILYHIILLIRLIKTINILKV